jgi:hypothetical protein
MFGPDRGRSHKAAGGTATSVATTLRGTIRLWLLWEADMR